MIRWRFNAATKAALSAAAALQILSMLDVVDPLVALGFVALPWSTLPAVVALFTARFPEPTLDTPGKLGLVALGAITFVSALGFLVHFQTLVTLGVLATAVLEEMTFRLAVPLVLLAVLLKFKVRQSTAVIGSLVISAALFVLLPGHLQQISDWWQTTAFIAFAAIMSYSVWRSGLIVPAIAAHATIDFLTLLDKGNVVDPDTRAWGVAATLIALLLVSISAAQEREMIIDLRDHADTPPLHDRWGTKI